MATEVAYGTGLNIFNHDKSRGKWPMPSDFLFACIGHAFKVDAVILLPSLLFEDLGIYCIIPYFLAMAICAVPVVFIQSFLGQFSSTGFISAFRISPLFKSIGYVALVVNLVVLMFFGVFGAIPLFHLFHTLRPSLPWSCEASLEWMEVKNNAISVCQENFTAEHIYIDVPSLDFFMSHLNANHMDTSKQPEATFSVWLVLCTFLVWIVVGAVLIQPMERIAKFLRYTFINMLVILGVCVVRFAFLPEAFSTTMDILMDAKAMFRDSWIFVPAIALSALGPGWGNVLTMASFNKFNQNTLRYSWYLCLAQFGVTVGLGLMTLFITGALHKGNLDEIYFRYKLTQWMEFLLTPTALTSMEMPRLWCWIFFTMMLLGALNLLTVQLFSVLTSLFDEFESLRTKKEKVTLIFVGVLALCSVPFCSNVGFTMAELLTLCLSVTQMLLNFLLLVAVLWVFGRERFQRDVDFMTGVVFREWKVYVIKFATPLFLLFGMLVGLFTYSAIAYTSVASVLICFAITMVCWVFIPVYCCFRVNRIQHCKRAVQPVDWYPAEPGDRQKYDEFLHGSPNFMTAMTTDAE